MWRLKLKNRAGSLIRYTSRPSKKEDKNLIVGYESSDDAAVYKISEDKAIIQTLDFFTTMINDPYLYGQIAATNALSDVYAMGGEVISALNIVAFPENMDLEILHQILKGGAEKFTKQEGFLLEDTLFMMLRQNMVYQ